MRFVGLLGLMTLAIGAMLVEAGPALAQATPSAQRGVTTQSSTDLPVQRRVRRRATPIFIYGHRPLSPTAVRACVDWYEQEFRPSGTVIVPRMRCHWVDG